MQASVSLFLTGLGLACCPLLSPTQDTHGAKRKVAFTCLPSLASGHLTADRGALPSPAVSRQLLSTWHTGDPQLWKTARLSSSPQSDHKIETIRKHSS